VHVIETGKSAPYSLLREGILKTLPLEVASLLSTTLNLLRSSHEESEKTIQFLESEISEKQFPFRRPLSADVAVELKLLVDRSEEVMNMSSSIVRITNGYIPCSWSDDQSKSIDRYGFSDDISSVLDSLLQGKFRWSRSSLGKTDEFNCNGLSDQESLQSEMRSKLLNLKEIQDLIHPLQDRLRKGWSIQGSPLTMSFANASMQLERLDQDLLSEVRQIEMDVESITEIKVLEDLAVKFASCIMDLRSVFRDVTIHTKVEKDFRAASQRFESHVIHVKNCFEAKLNLIEFLKTRFSSLEMNIPILVRLSIDTYRNRLCE